MGCQQTQMNLNADIPELIWVVSLFVSKTVASADDGDRVSTQNPSKVPLFPLLRCCIHTDRS